MSYAQAQCLTDWGDWRENIEEKVTSARRELTEREASSRSKQGKTGAQHTFPVLTS